MFNVSIFVYKQLCYLFLSSVLASLNLPAALEDLSGERVPHSLLEKAQQIQELGGLTKLDQLMSDLPDLLTRNREILQEVFLLPLT